MTKVVSFEKLPLDGEGRSRRVDEILSENHSLGFETAELPFWRVVVLEIGQVGDRLTIDIIFVWHHVIGDGRSGLAVHSTILQAFNSVQPRGDGELMLSCMGDKETEVFCEPEHEIVETPTTPLFPALEEILTLPMGMMTMISHKLRRWLPSWLCKTRSQGKWSGSPYHCEEPIKTKIRHISIPDTSVKGLVESCRSERTTITPFLQALVGKIIMETFDDASRVRCAVAISLRRFFPAHLQIDDSVMGLWVNAFHLEYTRVQLQGRKGELLPWDQARRNSKRIKSEIAKGQKDVGIGMLRYTDDFKSVLQGKMGKKREDSYAITNLGVFSDTAVDKADTSASPWLISNLLFSQSCHVNGSALQFCIVTTNGGEMSIALSWQENTISEEEAAHIADQLRAQLVQLGSRSGS